MKLQGIRKRTEKVERHTQKHFQSTYMWVEREKTVKNEFLLILRVEKKYILRKEIQKKKG